MQTAAGDDEDGDEDEDDEEAISRCFKKMPTVEKWYNGRTFVSFCQFQISFTRPKKNNAAIFKRLIGAFFFKNMPLFSSCFVLL